jgi:hypothetical protein
MPAPFANDWSQAGSVDILALGGTQLTMLAKKFEQFSGDPLAQFFPAQYTMDRTIVIERVTMDLGFAPIVEPGRPDALQPSTRVERMSVYPVYIRESDFLPQDVINNLREPGSMNEANGMRIVADRMQQLVARQNMLWTMLRAQCLLGSINYTDPRTGMKINVNTGIPSQNLVTVGTTPGFQAGDGSKVWTDDDANPIVDIIKMRRRMMNLAKTPPTSIIMTSDLKAMLESHPKIRAYLEGSGAGNVTGHVTWENGEIKAIAGLEVLTFDMIVDDGLITGTGGALSGSVGRHKIWPQHKIAVVAKNHQMQSGLSIGRTVFAPGEAPDGKPGLWSRSGPDTTPPQAPGRSVQIGNCGLPYVMYPDWIGIMTVAASAAAVENKIGGPTIIA